MSFAAGLELGRGLVAGLDGLGEADLVVLGQQRVLPDVGEVEPDEVFLVALDTLLGQGAPSCRLAGEKARSRNASRRREDASV